MNTPDLDKLAILLLRTIVGAAPRTPQTRCPRDGRLDHLVGGSAFHRPARFRYDAFIRLSERAADR